MSVVLLGVAFARAAAVSLAAPESADSPAPVSADSPESLEQRERALEEENKRLDEERKKLEEERRAAQTAKEASQQGLNSANSQIGSVQVVQSTLSTDIENANEELTQVMANVMIIEDEINQTTVKIAEAQTQYDDAKQQEETLYEAMKQRAKYMYEQGNITYFNILLESASYGEMLNKADYAESLYAYDRQQLDNYIATKNAAENYRITLEEEKSELETAEYELEQEQGYLNALIADYESQYDDYEVQLARLRQNAASYSAQLQQQTSTINSLTNQIAAKNAEREANEKAMEEARTRRETLEAQAAGVDTQAPVSGDAPVAAGRASSSASAAASVPATVTAPAGNGKSLSDYAAPGTLSGANVAAYAKQFIGNPYVAGGTSLTNGADCSGFVYSVYKQFGVTLPRTSWTQRNAGIAVEYENAQPGDLVCYAGHVGIYIGNGMIVHASSARTGIKISNATYRTIVAVRRIIL
ncbi:MAG: C40 family peptidase [Lachnospiraceae bacterium]|nr:C40 family peptidase [Lachnospiraceae bacterium]